MGVFQVPKTFECLSVTNQLAGCFTVIQAGCSLLIRAYLKIAIFQHIEKNVRLDSTCAMFLELELQENATLDFVAVTVSGFASESLFHIIKMDMTNDYFKEYVRLGPPATLSFE